MKVIKTLYAQEVHMGDIPLRQPIPTVNTQQVDPFLLLHHHVHEVQAGSNHLSSGVGPHPHRGFSPVTFIYQGGVHHRDSRGNSSVVKEGGVQWMDAGLGIVHSERPPAQLCENGGVQEIVQIWVNLPSHLKMKEPVYIPLQRLDMPAMPGHEKVYHVSGNVGSSSQGPLQSAYPMNSFFGELQPNSPLAFEVFEGDAACLYLLSGTGKLSGHGLVEEHNLYVLAPGKYQLESDTKMKLLYMSAKPIEEKVETYGPFVMNNQTEILEAMRDYQMGKMGVLIEHELD